MYDEIFLFDLFIFPAAAYHNKMYDYLNIVLVSTNSIENYYTYMLYSFFFIFLDTM